MGKKAGVIGHPINHSVSPHIHNYWLKQYGIEGTYEAIDVADEDLGEFMGTLVENGFSGINVTAPHKQSVMQYLDEIHTDAAAIGAVNTVIVEDGKTYGHNTDAQGFITNIQEALPDLDLFEKKVVVLGAGGASRAVAVALLEEGAKIIIVNRTREKSELLKSHLINELGQSFPEVNEEDAITLADWDQREEELKGAKLLVNTTSLGMSGKEDLEIDISNLPADAVVSDIVYNPLQTSLLKKAADKGLQTVDGLGMLLYQAEPGFYVWFGKRPEVTEDLRNHVLKELG